LDRLFKESSGENFEMVLPSGRVMHYFDVRKKGDGYVAKTELGGYYKHFYGAKLVENLVQATARDVFACHLLMLEDAGYDVLFHTHDEAVIELDEDADVSGIEQIMSFCPSWLEGCPVGAEAVESKHYLKS
jgi:DNA polymerase